MKYRSLVEMFFSQSTRLGDRPFLWRKSKGEWQSLSWQETAEKVAALAAGLQINPGDRVVVVAENRPEWLIADLGIMAAGGITTPAYTTNTIEDHRHIIDNSGAVAVIVSTPTLAEKIMAAVEISASKPRVITIDPINKPSEKWDDIINNGLGKKIDISNLERDDLACIIHTSGTGGRPKGVMTSHGAILHNCQGAAVLLEELGLEDEIFLSFLPLSHSYEHTAGQFFPIFIGAQIYYAESAEVLINYLSEVRPTIMTAVPRLYETMRTRILRAAAKDGGLKEKLLHKAAKLGADRYEGKSLGLWNRLVDNLLERLVRNKVRARFGGRLKAMVSGGAPLNYEVGLFFTALGLRILQGYGLTETAPIISCSPPSQIRIRTVGPALADTLVKIATDGEILVKGELTTTGYWNEAEATQNLIQDGWLHTGDIGIIGPDGFIQITDRKKDIIVNSGGDNISPQRVEGFLTLEAAIAQAIVYGDKRPHLVALLVPHEEFARNWAERIALPYNLASICGNPDFRKEMSAAVDRVNAKLSGIEKIRKFVIISEAFSVANEMLTPTLKVRRHMVKAKYGELLEGLY